MYLSTRGGQGMWRAQEQFLGRGRRRRVGMLPQASSHLALPLCSPTFNSHGKKHSFFAAFCTTSSVSHTLLLLLIPPTALVTLLPRRLVKHRGVGTHSTTSPPVVQQGIPRSLPAQGPDCEELEASSKSSASVGISTGRRQQTTQT